MFLEVIYLQTKEINLNSPAKNSSRIAAFLIDSILVYSLILLLRRLLALENVSNAMVSQIKNNINTNLLFSFYSIVFSNFIFKGQTIGKKIMKITVLKEQYEKIDIISLLNREIFGKIFIERINLWILLILSHTSLLDTLLLRVGDNVLYLILWYIISLPWVLFISFAMMINNKEHLSLHDRLSKTRVVSIK